MSASSFDHSKMSRQLAALHDALIGQGKTGDASKIVETQSRLALKQIINFTPPKNLAQGRNAIKGDLFGGRSLGATGAKKSLGIFFILKSWMIPKQGDRAVRLFARKDGTVYGVEKQLYRPKASIGEMQAHHMLYRSKRTGRTTLAGNYTRDVGRWKFVNQMVVSIGAARRYLAHVQSRVGLMKAGWAKAFIAVGGKPDAWVARHIPYARGYVINNLGNAQYPSITVSNQTSGIGEHRRIVDNALRARYQAMGKHIRLVLSGYSKDVANGIRPRRRAAQTAPIEPS